MPLKGFWWSIEEGALYSKGKKTRFDTSLLERGQSPLSNFPSKTKTKNTINFLNAFKRFLGGVLRRVLSPPQIKKAIASSLRFVPFLAMTFGGKARLLRRYARNDWMVKVRSFAKSAQDERVEVFQDDT